jgi:WD40 repeat protein
MAVAVDTRTLMTISQDRKLTYFNIDSGKVDKSFSPSIKSIENSKGNPFLNSITTSPNGGILCASSSDKTVHLIDTATGNSIFQGIGHGDLITDVSFINQGSHVASASADGCLFIWKLSESVKKKIDPSSFLVSTRPNSITPEVVPLTSQSPASVFRFDESTLPSWARTDVVNDQATVIVPPTQGRWAEVY